MVEQDTNGPAPVDDDIARLLGAAEAVIEAEDERVDHEVWAALILAPARTHLRSLIRLAIEQSRPERDPARQTPLPDGPDVKASRRDTLTRP
jgi:hypothetical protein